MERLIKMGYDGADIHYINTFFNTGRLRVYNPDTKKYRENIEKAKRDVAKLKLFYANADKDLIDKVIKLGKCGFDYTTVQLIE